MIDARNVLIAWTPADRTTFTTAGQLLVTDQDPRGLQSRPFMKTTGGQNTDEWRRASDGWLHAKLMRLALQMIIRDGIVPATVYDAFARIDQFKAAVHPELDDEEWPLWLSERARKTWEREGR